MAAGDILIIEITLGLYISLEIPTFARLSKNLDTLVRLKLVALDRLVA